MHIDANSEQGLRRLPGGNRRRDADELSDFCESALRFTESTASFIAASVRMQIILLEQVRELEELTGVLDPVDEDQRGCRNQERDRSRTHRV